MVPVEVTSSFLRMLGEVYRNAIRRGAVVTGVALIALAASYYWFRPATIVVLALYAIAMAIFFLLELFLVVKLWRIWRFS